MRTPLRTLFTPVAAIVLILGCVSFAAATSQQSVTPATSSVYPNEGAKPGCGPDKTDGVAGNSGRHEGQPPKADDRQDCPNPPGQQKQIAATTGGSSSIKSTSASVSGTVNPNGNAASAYFHYGQTPAFGQTTAAQSVGSGSSDKSLSSGVTALAPGTTYYYRVVATSKKDTVYGATKSFKTAGSSR